MTNNSSSWHQMCHGWHLWSKLNRWSCDIITHYLVFPILLLFLLSSSWEWHIEMRQEVKIQGNESDSRKEGEECGEDEVVCDDVTTSPVRFASQVTVMTHLTSRVNAVNKDTCGCTISTKIRAGCKIGHANTSYWYESLFRKYERKMMAMQLKYIVKQNNHWWFSWIAYHIHISSEKNK